MIASLLLFHSEGAKGQHAGRIQAFEWKPFSSEGGGLVTGSEKHLESKGAELAERKDSKGKDSQKKGGIIIALQEA